MDVTDRTYGGQKLETIEDFALDQMKLDMATHIRELQAELAELKLQHIASVSQAVELEAENAKLKAERREFAHGCVRASRDAVTARLIEARGKGENFYDAALTVDMLAIVEQELNK